MPKKPKRQNLKPPGKCIFCGSGDKSHEHIWSEWMHPLLPDYHTKYTRMNVSTSKHTPKIRGVEKSMIRDGNLITMSLRVVCQRCNNGWMSRLDTAVRPILTPMIRGEWAALNEERQKTLANWITMKFLVAENEDPKKSVTLAQDVEEFMRTKTIPPKWMIHIGRHGSEDWKIRYEANRTTLGMSVDGGPILAHDGTTRKNTQSIALGIGQLFIFAVSTRVPGLSLKSPPQFARNLHQLWPYRSGMIWPPRGIISHTAANFIASSLTDSTRDLPWRAGDD